MRLTQKWLTVRGRSQLALLLVVGLKRFSFGFLNSENGTDRLFQKSVRNYHGSLHRNTEEKTNTSVVGICIWYGGKYINHCDLKGFTNIYITQDLILLISDCIHVYLFSVLMKFVRRGTGRCLVKFTEGPTEIVGTDDTTFTLCSVRAHDFFKLKCTTWLLRRCTYVLFTPPQLSWQPNPFVMLRCFVRKVPLLLSRVQLRCYEKLFSNQIRGPSTLHSCAN